MKISKVVKKWGKSSIILLNKEDREILNVKPGDILTLDVVNVIHVEDENASS